MVDQNAEIGQLVTDYVAKKREIACLRSAINRCARQLETLAAVLRRDSSAVETTDAEFRLPKGRDTTVVRHEDVEPLSIRDNLRELHRALGERQRLENMLREAGLSELITADPPSTDTPPLIICNSQD